MSLLSFVPQPFPVLVCFPLGGVLPPGLEPTSYLTVEKRR